MHEEYAKSEYGHIIFDECHHLSAEKFSQVARRAKAAVL